jgi:hypothetical protein
MQLDELHLSERPVALLTATLSNINRDQKKQKKPIPLEAFYLYKRLDSDGMAEGRFGAAMAELIRLNQLPPWALFCYQGLMKTANSTPPSLLALMHENAIILAPRTAGEGMLEGLLIAKEEASEMRLVMTATDGSGEVLIQMPPVNTKVVAEEGLQLRILR